MAPTSPQVRERTTMAKAFMAVAREAGNILRGGYRTRPRAEEKSENDLVTEFDRWSQDLILGRLGKSFPGVPLIAEEDAPEAFEVPRGLSIAIDPLDGTANFVHGHPFYAIAIGALYDGHPIAGAVLAPTLAIEWEGAVDPRGEEGVALRNGAPCRVSRTNELRRAMLATGFPPDRRHAPDDNFDSFIRVKRAAQSVRRCGSAAIDIAFVADGTYDGYWERRLLLWDSAAAAAVVFAAGGDITAIGGGEPRYEKGHIVVSNGLIHDELVSAVG